MFEGQYLVADDGTPVSVYSPWMSRQGDNMTLRVDALELGTVYARLLVEVFHKDSEDTGPGTSAGTGVVAPSAAVWSKTYNGLKELVRYKFTFGTGSGTTADYVLFRMLAPVWWDSVKVS